MKPVIEMFKSGDYTITKGTSRSQKSDKFDHLLTAEVLFIFWDISFIVKSKY